MPRTSGRIRLPALRKAFYGVTHQWAAGETTGAIASGKTGVPDMVLIDSSFDFAVIGRTAIWSPATADQGKIQFKVNRSILFRGGQGGSTNDAGVYIGTIGAGRYPQTLRTPLLIEGGSTFYGIAGDFQTVAAAITLRTLHYGFIIQPDPIQSERFYDEEEYGRYTADFTVEGPNGASIGANKTQGLPVLVDPDADFEITKVVIVSDGEAKLQFKNVSRRTEWFNKAVHVWLLGGTIYGADPPAGAFPFRLPESTPELIDAGTTGYVTVQDLSNAANRVQVHFEGRRLKPPWFKGIAQSRGASEARAMEALQL